MGEQICSERRGGGNFFEKSEAWGPSNGEAANASQDPESVASHSGVDRVLLLFVRDSFPHSNFSQRFPSETQHAPKPEHEPTSPSQGSAVDGRDETLVEQPTRHLSRLLPIFKQTPSQR
jgi:hypothetical protein